MSGITQINAAVTLKNDSVSHYCALRFLCSSSQAFLIENSTSYEEVGLLGVLLGRLLSFSFLSMDQFKWTKNDNP